MRQEDFVANRSQLKMMIEHECSFSYELGVSVDSDKAANGEENLVIAYLEVWVLIHFCTQIYCLFCIT